MLQYKRKNVARSFDLDSLLNGSGGESARKKNQVLTNDKSEFLNEFMINEI